MNNIVNKNGIELAVGDYWTMVCPKNTFRKKDESWILKIFAIQPNGLVPVKYVNWKRNGKGFSFSRMVEDFGKISNLRKATEEEIKYFEKRNL